MKFNKEELEFLKLYALLSDTKSFLNDKVNIEFSKEDNIITFSQLSKKFNLITKLNKDLSELSETFSMVVEINKLYKLISSINKKYEIEFFNAGLKFNKSKYELENFDGDYSIVDSFISGLQNRRFQRINFTELDKMIVLKSFVGQDKLSCIRIVDGNLFASNRIDFTGSVKTSNTDEFYFPAEFISIILSLKINEVEFLKDGDFYYFKIDDTFIILNDFKYNLDNIFDEELKSMYCHESKVIINKELLLESLNRISIVAKDNVFGRIFASFDTNNILLESIDTGNSIETIPFESIDDSIKDTKIILSVNYLKIIIQSLSGEQVIMRISPDKDSVAIMIEDETNDRFFILVLVEENIE